jgi:hypothetical protein
MSLTLTPQQSLAMAYARLRAIRDDLEDPQPHALEALCVDFNRALDDLLAAGFDLSAFRLDGEEEIEDRAGWLRVRLDGILDYMDLFAGLP